MASNEFDMDVDDFDVIIIGAGLSGLTAAYNILKKHGGLSVLIIERQETIGGRLKYQDRGFYGHSFQNHISHLVEELDLPTVPSPPNDHKIRLFVTKNGVYEPKSSSIISCQVYYFVKALQAASTECRFQNHPHDDVESINLALMSVDEYIKQLVISSEARSICQSFIYAACGVVNLTNVSCLWFLMMLKGAGGLFQRLKLTMSTNTRYFVKGGMLNLIKSLTDRIVQENGIINRSEDVKSVKSNDFRVFVTTSSKTYKCGYVIIAVPPVESARIIIDETICSLDTRKVFEYYYCEITTYFEASYEQLWWTGEYSGTLLASLNNNASLRMTYDASHEEDGRLNLLAGFISDYKSHLYILQALSKYFKSDNAEICLKYRERREDNSPMNVLKPCALQNHLNPMLKPLNRVYFAASEYAKNYPGTADGAIEAGENAACLVLHHARPQVLNTLQIIEYIPPRNPPKCPSFCELHWAFGVTLITNIYILVVFFKRAYFP